MSITAAGQPGTSKTCCSARSPDCKVNLHNKVLSPTLSGEEFLLPFRQAVNDELDAPFVLVIEGSIPNEEISLRRSYWTSFGNDEATGEPLTLNWWIDRLAPRAWGSWRYLRHLRRHPRDGGREIRPAAWASRTTSAGTFARPVGCRSSTFPAAPSSPNFMETLTWLLYQAAAWRRQFRSTTLRPQWIFGKTVHEGCDRAGYYEQGDFTRRTTTRAEVPGEDRVLGPVVNCNVPKRGWMAGIGGCPNVGGICIGCTMPGFPDKFMPFMDAPPGGGLSSALTGSYGPVIRRLRGITNTTVNKEPKWRRRGHELTTAPRWGD